MLWTMNNQMQNSLADIQGPREADGGYKEDVRMADIEE